jgi:hypothetical protein
MALATGIRSVDDVLVEPRFLDGPREASDSRSAALGAARTVNPLAEMGDRQVILVHGTARVGTTSALLWLLAKAYRLDSERMPAYLTARESGLGTTRADATLAKAAGRFGYCRSAAAGEALRLAIDDIDLASEKKRLRILDFIAEAPQHRYLLAGDEECSGDLSAGLREAGVSFGQVFLARFGYRELCELAKRAPGAAAADVDLIASLIRSRRLPRTPSTMRTLINVSAARNESDDQSENDLLEDYADHLLRAEAPGLKDLGLGRRARVHLMAEIAAALDQAPDRSLPTLEAERRLVECFRGKGLSGSAGRIVETLVSRQVLVQSNDRLEFRDHAVRHLFLAHWMAERPDRKATILGECHRNREAIRHCAWLRRNDPEILERVTVHAAKAISGFVALSPARVDDLFEPFASERTWEKERLDAILRLLPTRAPKTSLDTTGDRFAAVLEREATPGDSPLAEQVHVLGEAVSLLSDVIESSELVDDTELKRGAFETAITGWALLIGALMAEDDGQSFRDLISDRVADVLGEHPWRSPEEEERASLIVALTTCSLSLQDRLGTSDLGETIAAALEREELTRSRCADCLATWLYVELELPQWPYRLGRLLDRLPRGSLLRDATVATCIDRLHPPCSEVVAGELESILIEKNAGRPRYRRRIQADLARYRRERPRKPVELSSREASVTAG